MWRNETKADIEEKKAKDLKKWTKESNWNPGYQQNYQIKKVDNTPYIDIGKQFEDARIREEKRKEKEKQDFTNKIASVQNDEKAFTPAELYEAGLIARKNGDGVESTMRLWQALICGEGKAAYPLFEILRDGEGGIPKNIEISIITLGIGKRYNEPECLAVGYVENPNIKATDKLFSVCAQSRKFITDQNKKITDEILFEREATANEVLDDFCLQTRAKNQPMLDVFQHPIMAEFEEKQEVHLAGNDESDTICNLCCIS